MAKYYLTPEGCFCNKGQQEEVLRLAAESGKGDPYLQDQYKNERVLVLFNTLKFGFNASKNVPQEYWHRYEVVVFNLVPVNGGIEERQDPQASKRFSDYEEARAYFQKFLTQYSDCYFDSITGEFMELGNELTPPDPDAPTEPEGEENDFGSW